ncbi:PREDICTED: box C/D snoRNA protein 1 isoform X2 [Crocodylus porosus]|uniref:box C/D snoRNA protein 1 isoform X2 n=1 Tax=Crocodylus porosus TaxID=8502 RepID=UPI00093EA2BB|nr:PREDICTED: box C/D snoRNA protein 1 isoform X2 [Crocodylus porosus]
MPVQVVAVGLAFPVEVEVEVEVEVVAAVPVETGVQAAALVPRLEAAAAAPPALGAVAASAGPVEAEASPLAASPLAVSAVPLEVEIEAEAGTSPEASPSVFIAAETVAGPLVAAEEAGVAAAALLVAQTGAVAVVPKEVEAKVASLPAAVEAAASHSGLGTERGPGSAVQPAHSHGKLSLQRCESCGGEEAKYRCPRCLKYSCSLPCVKKHKVALNCNGVREKTAFVSVNEFNDLNLLSDYRFLEDAGRLADCAARDVSLHRRTANKSINVLKRRARKYNIHLKTLPIGFSKRRENTTFFNIREQKFYWHLKLVFPHCHAEYTIQRVPDDKMLGEILKHYVDPVESDPVIRQRLKIYTMSPESDVQILMKVENRQHNSVRYNQLDTSKSLLDNLKDKVIIEYPTLLVVLKKIRNGMVVLGQDASDSSEDSDSESSSLSSLEEGEIRDCS